eukprot:s287_g10.t1
MINLLISQAEFEPRATCSATFILEGLSVRNGGWQSARGRCVLHFTSGLTGITGRRGRLGYDHLNVPPSVPFEWLVCPCQGLAGSRWYSATGGATACLGSPVPQGLQGMEVMTFVAQPLRGARIENSPRTHFEGS